MLTWLLLIYTVPAEPSRKRAFIWREIKKAGAIYVRDGVCALPEREDTLATLRAIAAKVELFGGQAILAQTVQLDPERAEALAAQIRGARVAEYDDIAREAEQFLEHLRREKAHRDFTLAELEELGADLGKLKRWAEQVRTRDYFGVAESARTRALLTRCEDALAMFLAEADKAAGTRR
jgi:predicted nuclease with TOPRIM domain